MTQYKLIKTYPGSPKSGTIDWFKTDEFGSSSSDKWQGLNFYDAHPEFWEKVEDLDYDILSVIGKDRRVISKANYTFPECFQTLVNQKNIFSIHSVKGLSDGEVFSVGDRVKSKRLIDSDSSIITKIYIDTNKDAKPLGGLIIQTGGYYQAKINEITKVKTPLFSTEDGVEIFEGDEYWYVVTFDHNIGHEWKPLNHVADWNGNAELMKPPLGGKQLSTEEKAQEYVLLNKPMLSLQDLLNVWGVSDEIGVYKTSLIFKKFEELAKSKL